jgi:catechol 2,3-dioxygenase-like lactoylglutathione lyase family enzyme
MLSAAKVMGFIPTRDFKRARAFYEGILGLVVTSVDDFAIAVDSSGIMVRIAKVEVLRPQPFTILGWEVPDIRKAVADLNQHGVPLEKLGFPGQDELGIWTAPNGTRVAWFKDPDGNTLSVTQFP